MQTRTQRFAGLAIKKVEARKGVSARDYKARADSFPTMVLQSGLTQALGFLCAKGGVYLDYANDVAKVIGLPSGNTLHENAIAASLPQYRRLTQEVLEASALIKRYASIVLKDDIQGGSHDD